MSSSQDACPLPPKAPASAPKELFRNEYVTAWLEADGAVVRSVRSAVPFPNLDIVEKTYTEVNQALDRAGRAGRSLLSDVRAAPGRNDRAFETLMTRLRARLMAGFERRATLVATAVGIMHLRRITREDGLERLISTDEAEIVRYLLGA